MNKITSKIIFHPVGQGGFTTGTLYSEDWRELFSWGYDCGTLSKRKNLKDSIVRLSRNKQNKWFDLFVISHFDADHQNCLGYLLKHFNIKELWLPFIAFEFRIALAIAKGIESNSPEFMFFVNPVQYLENLAAENDSEIEVIVFVEPSDGDTPTEIGGPEGEPTRPKAVNKTDLQKLGLPDFSKQKTCVRPANDRFIVNQLWEFVPYNDERYADKVTDEFITEVRAMCKEYLQLGASQKGSFKEMKEVFDKLKKKYEESFGKSSKNRNEISLFVYTGPVNRSLEAETRVSKLNAETMTFTWSYSINNQSLLLSGDGYLNTQLKFDSLNRHLTSHRIEQLHVLQVMHHGSKNNFFQGLASQIDPKVSIICADPFGRHSHPDAEVLKEFSIYQPIIVDLNTSVEVLHIV